MAINIEEYYEKYGPMVLRRCKFLLRNDDAAMDAMQDVFVKLLLYQNKLHDAYPSNLLYRIATNICLNMIRSNKKQSQYSDDETLLAIAHYDEVEEKIIAEEVIDKIFHSEKDSTREIAIMHYVDKMTLQEVAKISGMSVSGVRKRLRNLKERVKKLKDEYYENK